MKEPKDMKAKEIRDLLQRIAAEVDELQNEYDEYERELERRGLSTSL